jgi:hypothetical protein
LPSLVRGCLIPIELGFSLAEGGGAVSE